MHTASPASNLSFYLSELRRSPLLDAEEEQRLARQYRRTGDLRIAHKLVTSNLRFVVKVASEYRRYGLPSTDLVQEGNLGLMRAVEKFDPRRGNRLISYGVWWIRAYIQNYILRSWSLVKIGTTQVQRRLFFSLSRAKRELERLNGIDDFQDPTEALAAHMRVKPREIMEMEQRLSGRDLSLDAPTEEDGPPRLNLVEGSEQPADEKMEATQISKLLADAVEASMASLDSRERYIVERRVLGEKPATFKELGEHFGISRERARQLELRAKEKLHGLLKRSVEIDELSDGFAILEPAGQREYVS